MVIPFEFYREQNRSKNKKITIIITMMIMGIKFPPPYKMNPYFQPLGDVPPLSGSTSYGAFGVGVFTLNNGIYAY
jgi:hypothetical protein